MLRNIMGQCFQDGVEVFNLITRKMIGVNQSYMMYTIHLISFVILNLILTSAAKRQESKRVRGF